MSEDFQIVPANLTFAYGDFKYNENIKLYHITFIITLELVGDLNTRLKMNWLR